MSTVPTDLRGRMLRAQRQMADHAAKSYLGEQKIGYIATVDGNGWPYVLPMSFIYEGGPVLWFHTGGHHGHIFHNLESHPRICIAVGEKGGITPVDNGYVCDSSLLYRSVVVFGSVAVIEDRAKKIWFFDRMVEKYGDPSLTFKPGYPMVDRIILFRMDIEILTGKENVGGQH
jgi:nitroimidazol reductase NimA-like FMN-containing flavoprotein (pyridoxamine 5'-phosphate oxidase superfamily)